MWRQSSCHMLWRSVQTPVAHSRCALPLRTPVAHSRCALPLRTRVAHSRCALALRTRVAHSRCALADANLSDPHCMGSRPERHGRANVTQGPRHAGHMAQGPHAHAAAYPRCRLPTLRLTHASQPRSRPAGGALVGEGATEWQLCTRRPTAHIAAPKHGKHGPAARYFQADAQAWAC